MAGIAAPTTERKPRTSEKCGICYEMFTVTLDTTPCSNCERFHCHAHTEKTTVSEITPDLCIQCGAAYRADGADGLKWAKERLFRAYGS